MDFSLTEEQQILSRKAREFLEAECPTTVVREAENAEEGYLPDLWKKMANLGWLGVSLPENYGGIGGSLTDQTVLFEEIGRALVPGPMLTSSVLAAQILLDSRNETQKQNLLPEIWQVFLFSVFGFSNHRSRALCLQKFSGCTA